jgi:DNA-binding SARP family transcriptional activator/tetratricopeptide (TPR) repeat protein
MAPRRFLRCLGQPALFTPTGEQVRFRTKKHLALLVYLAVEAHQEHQRDRLAELLWPRVSLAEARHSLATALSVIRPRVGADALKATREQVSLAPGHLELDLDRLAAGDVGGSETSAPLEVAAFLEGFDIPDAGEFGLWKDRQQARWLPAVMSAFGQGLERRRRVGDTRQIERIADRMLALDPASEDAVRAKMEVLAFAGDRLAALRLFEAWRVRIAEELDAAPSAQLQRMAARLRQRGWERAALDNLPTAPPDQSRGRPFVGREAEYRTLYDAWRGLQQGQTTHILLTGESGVGKTRLVERLTTAASLDGAAVSRVQSYDLEQEIPYATVSGLILGLLTLPEVPGTPPEALAELSRTVPEVRRRFPAIPPARDSQGDTARIELAEAFHQLLQAIAEERPIILVVDDVHLADDASLSVLHLVARRARGERLMMIFIARLGGGAPPKPIERLTHGGAALGVQPLELRGLSREESTALLTCLADAGGVSLPSGVRTTLLRAARGVPMVLEFLLQDWLTNGDASLALAVSAMTSELAGDGKGPETYRHILAGLVRTLDPAARTVLDLAAILGPRLNDSSMYALADLSLGQTFSGLLQLASLRVLREKGDGFEFANELLRAEVYASIPSPLRRTLHGSIADRLLAIEGAMDVSGLEVAWHCVRAGRRDEALPHLLSGARQAMRQGAAHLAQRALETAMPDIAGTATLTEAKLLLVEALQEQGRWRDSLDHVLSLLESTHESAYWRAQILQAMAMQHLGTHYKPELRARLPELVSLVRGCNDPQIRVKAGRAAAYLIADLRERSLAAELLSLVDAIPAIHLDEDLLDELALTKGLLLYLAGSARSGQQLVRATNEKVKARGNVNFLAVQLISGLGTINAHEGKYEEAIPHFLQAHAMASRLGIDTTIAGLAGNLSLCYGRLAKYEEQQSWASAAPQPWGAEFGGFVEIQLAYCLGLSYGMRGEVSKVNGIIAQLEERLPSSLAPYLRQAWVLWKADLLYLAGHSREAHEAVKSIANAFGATPLSLSFTGAADRWMSVVVPRDRELQQLRLLVEEHETRLEEFDALDRVEILCAGAIIAARQGRDPSTHLARLETLLTELPPGVGALLRRLSFLPSIHGNTLDGLLNDHRTSAVEVRLGAS